MAAKSFFLVLRLILSSSRLNPLRRPQRKSYPLQQPIWGRVVTFRLANDAFQLESFNEVEITFLNRTRRRSAAI